MDLMTGMVRGDMLYVFMCDVMIVGDQGPLFQSDWCTVSPIGRQFMDS